AIGRLGVERHAGGTRKSRQNNVRAAHTAQHRLAGSDCGALANSVGPRTGAVENPAGIDALVFSRDAVSQEYALGPAAGHVNREHFTMVAYYGSPFAPFRHPLCHQTL